MKDSREGVYERLWNDFVFGRTRNMTEAMLYITASRYRHLSQHPDLAKKISLILGSKLDPDVQQNWESEMNGLVDELSVVKPPYKPAPVEQEEHISV